MVTCSCWRLISHFSMRRRSRRPTKRLIEDDGVDQPQENVPMTIKKNKHQLVSLIWFRTPRQVTLLAMN